MSLKRDVVNPATEEVVTSIEILEAEAVDEAIARSAAA